MRQLISSEIPSGELAVFRWVTENARNISVDTLLGTRWLGPVPGVEYYPEILVLKCLLQLLREKVRGVAPTRVAREGSFIHKHKLMTEIALRDEVHDMADKFCFHPGALSEYHPVHLAEMLVIVLNLLLENGINARVSTFEGR